MAAHGNHYSRQVQQLEGVINSKLKQVSGYQAAAPTTAWRASQAANPGHV